MDLFEDAVREQIRLRAMFDGPTGSGKTFTALQWARIIAGPTGRIALIDTESESAKRYAPTPEERAKGIERINYWDKPYEFGWRGFDPPFDPRGLAKLMNAAGPQLGKDGVLIVDSASHFWESEGGTLDIVDEHGDGNRFSGWKEGSPAQRNMLDAFMRCRCHLIVCMRSKMDYQLQEQTNKSGRSVQVPVRVGMAPVQRAGIEYEFDLVASMSLPDHTLMITKSRIDEIADKTAHKGRSHEVAEVLKAWLATGARKVSDAEGDELVALFGDLPTADRAAAKVTFVEVFGNPYNVLADRLDEARAWIAERHPKTEPAPAVTEPDPVPETPVEPQPKVPDTSPRPRRETATPADLPDDALEGMAAALEGAP